MKEIRRLANALSVDKHDTGVREAVIDQMSLLERCVQLIKCILHDGFVNDGELRRLGVEASESVYPLGKWM